MFFEIHIPEPNTNLRIATDTRVLNNFAVSTLKRFSVVLKFQMGSKKESTIGNEKVILMMPILIRLNQILMDFKEKVKNENDSP